MFFVRSSVLLILFPLFAFAKSPCDEMSAQEMERVEFQNGITVVACGEKSKGKVSALNVIQIQGQETSTLIEGDEAFKTYEVKKTAKSLLVTEALSGQDSKPFLKIEIACAGKACQKTESCLWKKAKIPKSEIEKLDKKLSAKSSSLSDADWEKAFYVVLNGSTSTAKYFDVEASGEQSDAAGSEAFETFKNDILRLKRAHCL